jgi:hypothetical protein
MGAKRIIKNITDFLDISNFTFNGKKKALKKLLLKLKKKRVQVLKQLKNESEEKDIKALQEELKLISHHIGKAKKKLISLQEK